MKDIFFNKEINFLFTKSDKDYFSKYVSFFFLKNHYYGFNTFFINFLKARFENNASNKFFYTKKEKLIIHKSVRSFLSRNFNFYKSFEMQLGSLYFCNNYRAWRHIRGLPVRGQRTWSNANNSYHTNTFLRKIIFRKAMYEYGSTSSSISNVAFLAEYANLTWKNQWFTEWSFMNEKRLQFKSTYSNYKIDLYSMAKFNIKVEKTQKVLSKRARRKKKSEVKNTFTTGFDVGFTKFFFKKSNTTVRANKIQLLTSKISEKTKKNLRRKVVDKKKKDADNKKKKKNQFEINVF